MVSKLRLCSLSLLLVAACTSNNHDSTLVRVDDEAAGENCEFGGVAIQSGEDSDDSGTLDDSEITATQYVCNGASKVSCGDGAAIIDHTVTVHDAADLAQFV